MGQNVRKLILDFFISEAQKLVSFLLQIALPLRIVLRDIWHCMNSAVHFNDQAMFGTVKIENKGFYCVLGSKPCPLQTTQSELFP